MLRINKSSLNEEDTPLLEVVGDYTDIGGTKSIFKNRVGDYQDIDKTKNIIKDSEMKTMQERMRRKQLSDRMQELKNLLNTEQNLSHRASKSTIVQKAIKYIGSLRVENRELEIQKLELQTKRQELQDTLFLLNQDEDVECSAREWDDIPMYVCDVTADCWFFSDDIDSMYQHEQEFHFLGEEGVHYKCDQPGCNQRYFSSKALIEHKKVHERKVKKPWSKASVTSVSLLKNPETFNCYHKFCSKTFTSYELYKSHVFEHKRCQEIRSGIFRNQNSVDQQKKNKRNNSHLNGQQGDVEFNETGGNKTAKVVYRCEKPLGKGKYCNKIFLNEEVMRVHDFIHEDLMLFKCPIYNCDFVYGLPSKVESHVQLYHFNSVSRIKMFKVESLKPLDFEERKNLNCRMQDVFATVSTSNNYNDMAVLMNNFLEAIIDAKIMMDEVREEVEETEMEDPLNEVEVTSDGIARYFQHQNIKFVEKNNVISRLDIDVKDKNKHKFQTNSEIEDIVVNIESDHIQDMVVKVEPDHEEELVFDEEEPIIEIDGVVTSNISDIPCKITDGLEEDVMISFDQEMDLP